MKKTRQPTHFVEDKAPRWIVGVALVISILAGWTVSAATLYVWQDSPKPTPPFGSWAQAATNIQDAVDAAVDGDTVLVMGGVYSTGGRAVFGTMTNRVAIDRAITVESLMGPEVTVIEGAPAPGSSDGNGDGAIRCVYVGTNAVLSGFTLTKGHTRSTGALSEEQLGGGAACEFSAFLTNCVLTGNVAANGGGGIWGGTLYNCTLATNSAFSGGGSLVGTLHNCTLVGNSAYNGGGANGSMLYNCTVRGNSAALGGGIAGGCLFNCIVYFNTAPSGPNYAGIWFWPPSPLVDPLINHSCTTPLPSQGTNNIDADPQMATLTHLSTSSPCIGAGSSDYATGVDIDGEPWADPPCMGADQLTPGQATGLLSMSIESEYTNVAPEFAVRFVASNLGPILSSVWDFDDGTLVTNQTITSHTWSTPGTYTVRLTGYNDSFLQGVSATAQVVVSDEVHYVNQASLSPAWPYNSWEAAATNIQDAIGAATIPGSLILVTNGVYGIGSTVAEGNNRIALTNFVVVRSVNGPSGTSIQAAPGIRCAYVGSKSVLEGFRLCEGQAESGGGAWCEPSATLWNCVIEFNLAFSGGGVYGGTLFNCSLRNNSADSGGGSFASTLHDCDLENNSAGYSGGGAEGSELYGCRLTLNAAGYMGGGTSGGTLHDCFLRFNSAYRGGGAHEGMLYNCVLTGNVAYSGGGFSSADGTVAEGGGISRSLYNCTVVGNAAVNDCGGLYHGTCYNCIVYFNTAPTFPNYRSVVSFDHSCTTPMPAGSDNITNAPVFVDLAAGDLHLRYGSPGIDAGTNLSNILTTDFDANPRPLDGNGDGVAAFDMGAYEFDARSIVPQDWFTSHGLDPADPQVVSGNPDHDPFTTFQEWLADTDPANAVSYFRIEAIDKSGPATVSFQSSSNRTYTLWSTPQLAPSDWTPVPGVEAIAGTGEKLTLYNGTNAPQQFYRVQVNLP